MLETFEIRQATLDDALELAATVAEGFESYREWLPAGWAPPTIPEEEERIRDRIVRADAWCVLARESGRPAGHVGFLGIPEVAGFAHLWMLFVRRPWWGSGLADELHRLAVHEATRRGYDAMRLKTPAGQARARAFYERRGWRTDGRAVAEPMLGLELVEYLRPLAPEPPGH
jgi:GNAT superfamily N-acetyltransferase